MKIVSYNINGIRSAFSKGLASWLQSVDADIVCFQETKAQPNQITDEIIPLIEQLGYHHYWHSAEKKGYSGVAILSKQKPLHIEVGCGNPDIDKEGRILRADFEDFSVISSYFPSGSSGEERQEVKYVFLDYIYDYLHQLKWKYPNLIVSGDYNICHKPIDIHNPKSNANSSGFLPEERAWMDKFVADDMIDTFRHFNQEPHHYTWWSFRAGARGKNLGWRIDYHMATESLKSRLKSSKILPEAKHSDHCPVLLELH
jgi:exodeoxyribonuclease III